MRGSPRQTIAELPTTTILGTSSFNLRSCASMALVLCQSSIEGLGGTVWRSQAVVLGSFHGLATASLDRATHQNRFDGILPQILFSCSGFLTAKRATNRTIRAV